MNRTKRLYTAVGGVGLVASALWSFTAVEHMPAECQNLEFSTAAMKRVPIDEWHPCSVGESVWTSGPYTRLSAVQPYVEKHEGGRSYGAAARGFMVGALVTVIVLSLIALVEWVRAGRR